MSDIKMVHVFGTSIYDDPAGRLSGAIVLHGPEKDAAIHAVSNHDSLVKQVAELRAALEEVSDFAVGLFETSIKGDRYFIGDAEYTKEVNIVKNITQEALKESE